MHEHVSEKGSQFYIWCLYCGAAINSLSTSGISGRGTINFLRGLVTLITEASVDEQGAVTIAEMNTS